VSSLVKRTTSASEKRRTEEIIVDLGDASVADDGGGVRGGFAVTGSCRRLHCEEQARHVDVVVLDGSAGGGCVVVASGMRRAGAALREARKTTHTTYLAELRLATGKQHSNHPRRARATRGPRRLHSCGKETEARKRSIRETTRPVRNTVGSRKGYACDAPSARMTRPKTGNDR
jgi:hypothetical protein